jgi:prevent-host-death family protein
MDTLNIHAAKTHFSGLVERAENGETIIIARAGKPVARLMPLDTASLARPKRPIGFMEGEYDIPDDFDIKEIGREEIEEMFYGEAED